MARKKTTPANGPPKTNAVEKAKLPADNAVQLADFAATAVTAAEQFGIKPLEHFSLSPAQREVLLAVPDISKSIKTKLAKDKASFTVAEVAGQCVVAETSFHDAQSNLRRE